MRSSYFGGVIAASLLAVVLTGCDDSKSNITVSNNAVSINEISVSSNTISNNNIDGMTVTDMDEASVSDNEANQGMQSEDEYVSVKDAMIGDCIIYGSYEQDGDLDQAEPIEWIVIDKDDDKLLVLSKYVIEKKAFNDTDTAVYWSQSTIRKWLNEDFIEVAFSDSEQEKIVTSILENPGSSGYFSEFEKNGGTATGNNTEDRVFLLSYAEAIEYFEPVKVDKFYIYASSGLITTATPASGLENEALSEDYYESFYQEEGWPEGCVNVEGSGWFLRSHGINSDDVMSVGYDGGIRGYYFGYGADYESVTFEGGIRPAMWIERR